MGYCRVAIPVWVIVSVVSVAVSVEAGHSVAFGFGWALGWLTVVLALRWFITTDRPRV